MIATGVSVAGVPVGGMTAAQAQAWVSQSVLGQITVTVGTQSWTVGAAALGLHAYIARPLCIALAEGRTTAVDGQDIPRSSHDWNPAATRRHHDGARLD